MSYNRRGKYDYCLLLKTLFFDCLKKICKNNPIFKKEIPNEIIANDRQISNLTSDKKQLIFESFADIYNFNHDFSILTIKFLIESNEPKNVETLINFISMLHSGYYLIKAIIMLLLKLILMILLLSLSILLIYPKNENINVNEKDYYIFEIKKYKISIKITPEIVLRIIIFFIFDLNFIIGEILFLRKFERKKIRPKYFLLFLQIIKYILNAIIYINKLLPLKKKNLDYDETIFYKNNYIIEILLLLIIDLLKFIIK